MIHEREGIVIGVRGLLDIFIFVFIMLFFWGESIPKGQAIYFIKTQTEYSESWVTKGAISSGVDSIQTCSLPPESDFLARKRATILLMRFTCEKLQHRKSLATIKMSFITCPYSGLPMSPARIALTRTSASPSKEI